MIDENLPTFFLKNNSQTPQQSNIYSRHNGNDPEPAYNLKFLDPTAPSSQNRYGVALCDPYVTDIIYGEVAVIPEWTQPSLSAEAVRNNGGAAPPPEPILPTEFSIHLYNPDQEIVVRHQPKAWNKPARWEFEMPQRSFRVPSASRLDRTQSDPAVADITPRLCFSWRKDGKLSKDLSCLLHGKTTSTVAEQKTKNREPDITVAMFQGLKELTLYEPNLYRVEMEDFKGLEVVLLLAAVAIRDIFFGLAKEAFHISTGGPTVANGKPQAGAVGRKSPKAQAAGAVPGRPPLGGRNSISNPTSPGPQARRRQDEVAEQEERRTQELLVTEKRQQEQARRRKEAEVDSETKRLQQIYGQEEQQARMQRPSSAAASRPNLPVRHSGPSRPYNSHQYSQSQSVISQPPQQPPRPSYPPRPQSYYPQGRPVPPPSNGPYLYAQPSGRPDPRIQSTASFGPGRPPQPRPQSTVGFVPAVSGALQPGQEPARPQQLQPKKSSFFGFRRKEEGSAPNKLDKKRSSMF
ncbi:hypothetical protein N7478_009983 [Penicillium angulare]|uniref:uncharacterized protein n=1 Tax=Penicillium angulare TaxID=116970 RepID=UPI0025421988|nr:uncharacterized protein N7478_009983 [Penicillium angulare]KAJ5267175.1 hypothetical protein N7478_009983 [Penicillium angulare]